MSKLLAAPALLLALLLAPAGCDVDDDKSNTPRDEGGEPPSDLADTDGDDTDTDTDGGGDSDSGECSLRGVLLPPVTGGGPIGDCP